MEMSNMPMPTSSPSSDTSTSMSMGSVGVIFFSSTSTPLFSAAWTPTTTGAYAGTCIFLIILAIIYRALHALAVVTEKRWADRDRNRRYVTVANASRPSVADSVNSDPNAKNAMLVSERGVEESVRVVARHTRAVMPWRLSVDLPRAALQTVVAGTGYLLMLVVMTLNVGYFLSILAGWFVGELAVGRYSHTSEH